VSAGRLKSSLVNTTQASCSERSESAARYRRTTVPANKHEKLVFVPSDDVDPDYGVQQPGNSGAAAAAA
jgi:hypothetical protein